MIFRKLLAVGALLTPFAMPVAVTGSLTFLPGLADAGPTCSVTNNLRNTRIDRNFTRRTRVSWGTGEFCSVFGANGSIFRVTDTSRDGRCVFLEHQGRTVRGSRTCDGRTRVVRLSNVNNRSAVNLRRDRDRTVSTICNRSGNGFGLLGCETITIANWDGGSHDGDQEVSEVSVAEGLWINECQVENSGGTQTAINISGSDATRSIVKFYDNSCQSSEYVLKTGIDLTFGEEVITSSGTSGQEIDMAGYIYGMIPATKRAARKFNRRQLCGLSDYAVGETTMLPADCNAISELAGTTFDLVAVEDDTLYLSDQDTNARSPEDRPADIDRTVPFTLTL